MPQETFLTAAAARLLSVPFRFGRRPFSTPKKALILHPCCLSQVLLATPLLSVLTAAFPHTQFDWAVSEWARPAIAKNPLITELLPTGDLGVAPLSFLEMRGIAEKLRQGNYDTCLILGRASMLSWVAWQAGIPQRIGVASSGRGFANTLTAPTRTGQQHATDVYLSLAEACGIDMPHGERPPMAFYPADDDRTAVTQRLIDDLNWLGDVPLVVIHPGGGAGSLYEDPLKRWPTERFVLLINHLARQHNARILLVGSQHDQPLATAIAGMTSVNCANWAGRVTLGEVGSLGEIANLYVGNDTGPTHIAAATGCPTLAIFGPSNPNVSAPFSPKTERVITVWNAEAGRPFSWDNGVTVTEAIKAATQLLNLKS